MKKSLRVILGGLFVTLALSLTAATVRAQDPVKVAPRNFKVLMENDRVRVLDFTSKAGEKIPMHSHPGYITYIISGTGKTTYTLPDGKTRELPAKVGEATWHDAETHASVSSAAVHVLLVELKK